MIVKQYIKEFEKLGFGMFVHFGLYSVLEKGEWALECLKVPAEEYALLPGRFNPKPEWARELAAAAKGAGCRYITLTTRHHEGFSLYDTKGLSIYDATHAACGRDLVREFVDACREQNIIPFFYHTLLDWHEESYRTDFPAYLQYLRDSVELLCRDYGKIGGIWFDGMWDKPDADWEEDALYGMIRRYQPEAMIINNTGLSARGELGHIELDSVTFERGKPQPLNFEGVPKYVASEMCEIFADHWGYAREDLNYHSPAQMICELAQCRRYGANMLLNVGPMGDGSLRPMDGATLGIVGEWVAYYEEAIRAPRPSGIPVANKEEDFLLRDGNDYYLFCFGLPMRADANVAQNEEADFSDRFELEEKIASITWMDNGKPVVYEQEGSQVIVHTVPFCYGRNLVVRVAKIVCAE